MRKIFNYLIIFNLFLILITESVSGASISRFISSGLDDAYQNNVYSQYETSSNARWGASNPYHTGLRFQNVNIPSDVTITYAKISVYGGYNSGTPVYADIYGEDTNSCEYFATWTPKIHQRTKTSARVSWDITSDPGNSWFDSPDISNVIQEIVNRGGWSSGNSLCIIVWGDSGSSGYKDIRTYEFSSSRAAILSVSYEFPTTTSTTTTIDNPPYGTLSVSPTQAIVGEDITITIDAYDDIEVKAIYAYYSGTWHQESEGSGSCPTPQHCTVTWTTSESSPGTYTYYGSISDGTQGAYTTPDHVDVNVEATTTTTTIDNSPTGEMSVDKTTVNVGETFHITIAGNDDIGVDVLILNPNIGMYDCLGETTCSHTWEISKSSPGTYSYSGFVADTSSQIVNTDPSSVSVIVLAPTTTTISCAYNCWDECVDDTTPPDCFDRISHGTDGCSGGLICCESNAVDCPTTTTTIDDPPYGTLSVSPTQAIVGEDITITIDAYDDIEVKAIYAYYSGTWHQESEGSGSCPTPQHCTVTWTTSESSPGTYTYYGSISDGTQGAYTTPDHVDVNVEAISTTTTTSTTTSTTTTTTTISCAYNCWDECVDDTTPPDCFDRISHGTDGCSGGLICCESNAVDCPTTTTTIDDPPSVTIEPSECNSPVFPCERNLGETIDITVSVSDDYGIDNIVFSIAGEFGHPTGEENYQYYSCNGETSCENTWSVLLDQMGTDDRADWSFWGIANDTTGQWSDWEPLFVNVVTPTTTTSTPTTTTTSTSTSTTILNKPFDWWIEW